MKYDKNGKRHSVSTSTYYFSGGEEVEYDEEYDDFDIEDLDDEDVSHRSSYYWHGKDISREEYTRKVKQHGKWLKGMESLDLSALKKLLGNSDFVTDFAVGSRWIALMLCIAVLRVKLIHFKHKTVPFIFG